MALGLEKNNDVIYVLVYCVEALVISMVVFFGIICHLCPEAGLMQ